MLNETWIIMLLMSGKCRNFALEFRNSHSDVSINKR